MVSALKTKLGTTTGSSNNNNKRTRSESERQANGDNGGDQGSAAPALKRMRTRLVQELEEKPVRCPTNQKIVDAFKKYGMDQLAQGHTGKAVAHLRAARQFQEYDAPIQSYSDAREIGYVGDVMARQVEEVLKTGVIKDEHPDWNEREIHEDSQLLKDVRSFEARHQDNQGIVDALADYGEHELKYGNTGKGISHLRAAREILMIDYPIKSGSEARTAPMVGDVIAQKIEQILQYGKIVDPEQGGQRGKSSRSKQRVRGDLAPIVQDLVDNPAKKPENQTIVDKLTEYGDSHLHSGHRGRGISHLRAAQAIRDSDQVIKSGQQAKEIPMVGPRVAEKIDQILEHGHVDSDVGEEEDDDEEEAPEPEEERSAEFGERETSLPVPLVMDARGKPALRVDNQKLVERLTDYGESELINARTRRAVTFLRAALQVRDSEDVIKSGSQGKVKGMFGDKVAAFIDSVLSE